LYPTQTVPRLFDILFQPTPVTSTLTLHDALPISKSYSAMSKIERISKHSYALHMADGRVYTLSNHVGGDLDSMLWRIPMRNWERSEEHTSELQSRFDLVCRLLLEKKKIKRHLDSI